MNGRERMLKTYAFEPTDRPPHFENMFELEDEAFGLRFPSWDAWREPGPAKTAAIGRAMEIYDRIIDRFQWDALAVYFPWSDPEGVRAARRAFEGRVLVGTLVGGAVWCIDTIRDWDAFAADLADAPERIHEEARRRCREGLEQIDRLVDAGAEFIVLVHDVAFNAGPFCSPACFDEIVTPYLAQLVDRVKSRGAFCTVHSDGNLMPILDSMLSTRPHALHSIDPQAGMDIAQVHARTYLQRVVLMGNVECRLMQDGPDEAIERAARYCLETCAPGGGYIFSTSNTIFRGMPLRNYERMLAVRDDYVARRPRR